MNHVLNCKLWTPNRVVQGGLNDGRGGLGHGRGSFPNNGGGDGRGQMERNGCFAVRKMDRRIVVVVVRGGWHVRGL